MAKRNGYVTGWIAFDACRDHGASLWVLDENAAAIAFCRKSGFVPDGERSQQIIRGGRQAREVHFVCPYIIPQKKT